jgi:putative phosphonate metabolism protein
MRRDANGVSMAGARYAVYFAPGAGSGLELVCASVLGRCARTEKELAQPVLPGVEPQRLAELTASPRRYGLHGTLKPPFFLAEGMTEAGLLDAVALLAAGRRAFELPPLRLESIGSFLALIPSVRCPELDALARACVTELDHFRRPPSAEELARRRARGLTAGQDRLLERWGYPYVLDEFRFHLTLTDTIPTSKERELLRASLAPLLSPVLHTPVQVRDICVFRQRCSMEPFAIMQRFDLALIPEPDIS